MSEVYNFSRKNRTVWWPVKINEPLDDGEVNTITISMQLSLPKKDEAKASREMPQDEFEQYMLERVLNWKDIEEGGEPVPFSKENYAALLQDPFFEAGVTTALVQAGFGGRAKN